ncbi:MAG: hypothetical protein DRG33_05210, partial [Deltaproteobacteria bacterium]
MILHNRQNINTIKNSNKTKSALILAFVFVFLLLSPMAKGEQQPQEIKLLIIHPGGDPYDNVPDNNIDLAWKNLAEKFAEYKTNTGIPAKALGLWEINRDFNGRDTAEKIKRAISYYVHNYNTRYVLLVGDGTIFPVRYHFGGWSSYGGPRIKEKDGQCKHFCGYFFVPADFYFADLYDQNGNFNDWNKNGNQLIGEVYRDSFDIDGVDLHPDVAVGRVPCKTPEEFLHYIIKVVKYEKSIRDSSGYHKVLFVSDHYPNYYDPNDYETNKDIGNNILPQSWDKAYVRQQKVGEEEVGRETRVYCEYYYENYDGTEEKIDTPNQDSVASFITDVVNRENPQFINYNGHGVPIGWAISGWTHGVGSGDVKVRGFRRSDASNLSNDIPHIVFVGACETGHFVTHGHFCDRSQALACSTDYSGETVDHIFRYVTNQDCQNLCTSNSCSQPTQWRTTNGDRDCIAESFINNPNGGAVVYIGSDPEVQSWCQILNKYFFKAIVNGDATVGDAWRDALEEFANRDKPSVGSYKTECEQKVYDWIPFKKFLAPLKYHLFGDPSLRIEGITGVSDTTAPAISIFNWPGRYTNISELSFFVCIAAEDRSGVLAVEYRYKMGNQDWTQWSWSFSSNPISISLPIGHEGEELTLEVRAIDIFGNNATRTYTTTFDFTPPECRVEEIDGEIIGFYLNPLHPPVGPSPVATKIYGCPVTVFFEAEDAISPTTIYYKVDEEGDWHQGDYVRIPCDIRNPGVHQFEITYYAEDAAGNKGDEKTIKLLVDTTPDVKEWIRGQEKLEKLLAAEALEEIWRFQLMEEAFVDVPKKVRVDFRGPVTAENRNPAWQPIGEATNVIRQGKTFWQAPSWNTRNLPTGWYEIRFLPSYSSFAEEKSVNFFVFVSKITHKNYDFKIEVNKDKVKPGDKLRIKVTFKQNVGKLSDLRLGLFIGPSLIEEGRVEFKRESLEPDTEWSEVFDITLVRDLAPQDVKFKAYVYSKDVGWFKSKPIAFSVVSKVPEVSLSKNIYFTSAKENPGSIYEYNNLTKKEKKIFTRERGQIYSFAFHPE